MMNVQAVLTLTNKVSQEQIADAITRHGDSDQAWRYLLGTNGLTEIDVFQALASSLNLEFVDGRTQEISDGLAVRMPAQLCREERIIPIEERDEYLFVGTDQPTNLEAFDELQALTNLVVVPSVMTTSVVSTLINKYFRQDAEISQLSEQLEAVSEDDDAPAEDIQSDDGDSPIVRFVNLLIMQAIRDRASDVHVEPTENELVVRYRIDGILRTMQKADSGIKRGVISRLKVMSEIDIAEKRKPQDGRMTVNSGGKRVDIRVTTLPTIWGEKIVMRILDGSSAVGDIRALEMSPKNESIFRNAITKPHGLVLITGPTGSGKSSSLYAVLDEVTDPSMSVVTVENPIERKMQGVSQIQVNPKAGLTFAVALRSILRADPDIVLIGEIRDEETAKIAIDASMTGHLVLATLHTNGAPEAAARLIEMGVEPYLVGSSVSCVVAQRLARRLCEDCKLPEEADPAVLNSVSFPEELRNSQFYRPIGCTSCSDTGFRGRIALTEAMAMDEEIEKLILEGQSSRIIRNNAESRGLASLREDGFLKVARGITTIAEVLRVTTN